jgi:hypothetical protein
MDTALAKGAQQVTIEHLCAEWIRAKAAENKAAEERIAIENKIIAIVGAKAEGAETHKIADQWKLTVAGRVTRKMDWAKWETVKNQIPEALRPVKFKPELDERGVKYLQANEPAIYALLPIEVKPAKTAVTVEMK